MADDMTREEMLGTLHGTRHERCIPSHAVTNPVPMPSTSNYQRDMAIGVDKSEFLKIVMRKEEDSRCGAHDVLQACRGLTQRHTPMAS